MEGHWASSGRRGRSFSWLAPGCAGTGQQSLWV